MPCGCKGRKSGGGAKAACTGPNCPKASTTTVKSKTSPLSVRKASARAGARRYANTKKVTKIKKK